MIYLDSMPCSNCEYFVDTKRKGKEESTEYIKCAVAKDKDAKNILKFSDRTVSCDKQKVIDEWP